jgi:hypothetical protein
MKTLLILPAVIFFITAGVNAQTNELLVKNDIQNDKQDEFVMKVNIRENKKELRKPKGAEVSDIAKEQFIQDFGNIPVDAWERTDNFDEATFAKDGLVMSAFYDDHAQLVATITEETFSDLPFKAREWINKKYPEYTIEDVFFYDDNEFNETDDMSVYNTPFAGEDSYFVDVKKDNKEIVLQVNIDGFVSYFARLN